MVEKENRNSLEFYKVVFVFQSRRSLKKRGKWQYSYWIELHLSMCEILSKLNFFGTICLKASAVAAWKVIRREEWTPIMRAVQ